MAHHLDVAPNPDMPAAEFVLEAGIHPLGHCALVVAYRLSRIEFDLHATARGVIDQRNVTPLPAVRPQVGATIGGVHHVAAMRHPIRSDARQRDRRLAVMHRGAGQQGADDDAAVGGVEV